MNTAEDRQTLKSSREVLRGAQKWLRINQDLLSESAILGVRTKINELAAALKTENAKATAARADELEQKIRGVLPVSKSASLRENIEVLLVAILVAMAVRTFFIQPFKIPTGSMQPTLFGVFPPPEYPSAPYQGAPPNLVQRLAGVIFGGHIYDAYGYRTRGDHIFVDKISYHFRKPRRGEVIVFDTSHIPEIPSPSRGNFYIKRLIGLENDTIQIKPPYVYVNGEILGQGMTAFEHMYSLENGYHGYVIPETFPSAKYLGSTSATYIVPPRHLFPLGDNSRSSLDGRFWGSVPREDLVGRAVFVYWPFSKRFGLID